MESLNLQQPFTTICTMLRPLFAKAFNQVGRSVSWRVQSVGGRMCMHRPHVWSILRPFHPEHFNAVFGLVGLYLDEAWQNGFRGLHCILWCKATNSQRPYGYGHFRK